MAGDWIKMRIGIEQDPAVFAISSRLKLDRFAVVGRLSAFWSWMNQHSEDGSVTLAGNVTGNAPDNAASDSCEMIDTIAGVSGFAEALQAVGWLILTRVGFSIPSYDKYNRSSPRLVPQMPSGKHVTKKNSGPQKQPNHHHKPTVTRYLTLPVTPQ